MVFSPFSSPGRLSRLWLCCPALILLLLAAVACTSLDGPDSSGAGFEPVEVYLDLDYDLDGDTLLVAGSTNLVNGTVLAVSFYISEYDGMEAGGEATAAPVERDEHITVRDGRFSLAYDLSDLKGWWRGQNLFVVSSLGDGARQPARVRQAYGDYFERIDGPNTSRVADTVNGDVREGKELRMHKEINWDGEAVTAVPY